MVVVIRTLYFFLILAALTVSISRQDVFNDNDDNNNDGPPFLYVTVHDEVKNILKFNRNGRLLSENVLVGGKIHLDSELRSMIVGTYRGEKALFVADASSLRSQVLLYKLCSDSISWCFVDSIVRKEDNPGVDHTYGVCFDDDGNLYASFQHTDTVLRFERDSFRPMDINPSYSFSRLSYFDGTFVQFGEPVEHTKVARGVRSIVYVDGNLWISNEDLEGVVVVSVATGKIITIVTVSSPVGLHYREDYGTVFVGCRSAQFGGVVYAIDKNTFDVKNTFYRSKHFKHPTGITSWRHILYVAEQSRNVIHSFHIVTGKHLGKVVDDTSIPGKVEQLYLSDV